MIGGVAIGLAGCAQEPLPPAGTPDTCILLCALIRSVFDPPDPAPAPIPKPVKPVHPPQKLADATQPVSRHKTRKVSPPPATAAEAVQGMAPGPEAPTGSTVVPQTTERQQPSPAAPVLGYTLLPGSAPIEENTSHFTPVAAEQR